MRDLCQVEDRVHAVNVPEVSEAGRGQDMSSTEQPAGCQSHPQDMEKAESNPALDPHTAPSSVCLPDPQVDGNPSYGAHLFLVV
jgi:hypothetical protein